MSKARQLRALFKKDEVIRVVGAHNGLTAKMVELNGFECVWASGFEVSTAHAVPDASILTMTQYLEAASMMNDAVSIPVIADCDTGYGNSTNVMHMVRKYEAAGIAAVAIEDKKFPKTNSFIAGRQELASIAEFVGKILAAKNAQESEDFMVIARIEALIAGWGQEEALTRAHAYVEAGADAILIHSKSDKPDEIVAFASAWDFSAPLVIVPTTYPMLTLTQTRELGIKVVIYANQGLRASVKAVNSVLAEIRREGRLDTVTDKIAPMNQLFELQGMPEIKEHEAVFLRSDEVPTRVVIPAAGAPRNQPSLAPLLQDVPLAMLDISGKSLLQRNVEALNRAELYDISVVRGYKSDAFNVDGLTVFDNPRYESEHILSSIMCAIGSTDSRTMVVYGDILFESWLIQRLRSTGSDFVVVVDSSFRKGLQRNKKLDLVVTKEPLPSGRRIMSNDQLYTVERIGTELSDEGASGEFIGAAMFSEKGTKILRQVYLEACNEYDSKPFHDAENIHRASLDDMIQHLVDLGHEVKAMLVTSGWLEIHTFENYVYACSLSK